MSEPVGSEIPGPEVPESGPPGSGVICGLCRAAAAWSGTTALTWVRERDGYGRERWLCPACARRHVRDMEAKLAREWW